jgi:glycosyltransferase 2 family protein
VRRKIIPIVQWFFAIAVVILAVVAVARQWHSLRGRLVTLDIDWGYIAFASVLVLLSYAVLIETWRRVLGAWDTTLPWLASARIWFASSLGKYIPGNVWAIAALGIMAKKRGASSIAATGSSVIVNVLNLASGLAVVLFCGSKLLPTITIFGRAANVAVLTTVAVVVIGAAVMSPIVLPPITAWLCRVTGKDVRLPEIPAATIWLSLAGTTAGWILYGIAFRFYAMGILGRGGESEPFVSYIAVYTGAYIVGFITPVAPAGLGVREALLAQGLMRFDLMNGADATIVALTSRLWLTVLEVIPGLVALAASQTRTRTRPA